MRSFANDEPAQPRLLPLITGVFVAVFVVSNIIAVKIIEVGSWTLPAAVVVFPISYILGDTLTEVYGYATARRVIWTAFACNLIGVAAIVAGERLPSAAFWGDQQAYETILGYAPRLLVASFAAFLVGEFANAVVLSRLKLRTGGRFLWLRTIGSTLVGQALDSGLFIAIAFAGTFSGHDLFTLAWHQWAFKVGYEVAATPLTYVVVTAMKKFEHRDAFDRGESLNPLRI